MKGKMIVIHKENNVKFCMTDEIKPEYKVLVGREVYYTHWNFDIAVKEYEILRKSESKQ